MKKLLYLFLFLTLILIGCSESAVDKNNGDTTIEDNTPINPPTITFTLREIWKSKLIWDKSNTGYDDDRVFCGNKTPTVFAPSNSDITGFETNQITHFGLDTLVINLERRYPYEKPLLFDFVLSGIFSGGYISHPKRIGHIEFIGFNEEKRILLETSKMNRKKINGEWETPIDYFSSNLSEEFIESITLDWSCTNKKIFHKKDYDENYFESTIVEITVPKDDNNSKLEVGDKIGRVSYDDTRLGEGWDSRFNNRYLILDKK
jgi:hypothetical protein